MCLLAIFSHLKNLHFVDFALVLTLLAQHSAPSLHQSTSLFGNFVLNDVKEIEDRLVKFEY